MALGLEKQIISLVVEYGVGYNPTFVFENN